MSILPRIKSVQMHSLNSNLHQFWSKSFIFLVPQKEIFRAVTISGEVIGVDGPDHGAGDVQVVDKLGLNPQGLDVVVANPVGTVVCFKERLLLVDFFLRVETLSCRTIFATADSHE